MDAAIIAALIGGAFAIIAALIPLIIKRSKKATSTKEDRSYGIVWWKNRVGKAITKDDYLKGFDEIVGNKIKKGILLKVELNNEQLIIGYLDAQASGYKKGYVYTFIDKFGKHHSCSPHDIGQVLVERVNEVKE